MIINVRHVVFMFFRVLFGLGLLGTPVAGAAEPHTPPLRAFDLLSPTEGWLLVGQQLYWTRSHGQSWQEITPPRPASAQIQAVSFVDASHGWAALTEPDEAGFSTVTVARTHNGGQSWQTAPLAPLPPGDPAARVGAVHLHFIDPDTGWLVLKRATSPNFSRGVLFKTTDGGQTWLQLPLPLGEPVYFVTEQQGWTAGGVTGAALYRTEDGGQTWLEASLPEPALPGEQSRRYHLPVFETPQAGLLPVRINTSDQSQVLFYATEDGGHTWHRQSSVRLSQVVDVMAALPLAVFDQQRWRLVDPGHTRLLTSAGDNQVAATRSSDPLTSGLYRLDLVTSETGWASYLQGECQLDPVGTRICQQDTRLLSTVDGGQSWQTVTLPGAQAAGGDQPVEQTIRPIQSQGTGDRTGVLIGQGFDKCEVAKLTQLDAWSRYSPYQAVNLYIGGINRGCGNTALTAEYVAQIQQQGWRLIPTWVGPQAACSDYAIRMSYEPGLAYYQGRSEAEAAVATAHALGLTLPDQSGTIVYYDLEYYQYNNSACHTAAQAFISGWTAYMHDRGNQAGVYSNGPPLNGLATLTNLPDAIWPAHWIADGYSPEATVWDVYGLSNTLWMNQQRIRQYAGDHLETWGGVTLHIDSNVLEGPVAVTGYNWSLFVPFIRGAPGEPGYE